MLLWWETRCCVWFHCLLLEDITRTLLPLLKPHWSTGTFVEGTSCRFAVHCPGLAKARCSFLPCFLTCWESAASPDTVWPNQKWPSQSIQQAKKSGSEKNRCPCFQPVCSWAQPAFWRIWKRSRDPSTWPHLALPGLCLTVVPSPGWAWSWPLPWEDIVAHPHWGGQCPRLGLAWPPLSFAGMAMLPAPGGSPTAPGSPFRSSAFFFPPFSFSHLLTYSYTNERVTLFPEPESLELHSNAWAMLLPSSSPSKQCPSMSIWNIKMYYRNCSRWFWLFFPPTSKARNYCVFWREEKTPSVLYS